MHNEITAQPISTQAVLQQLEQQTLPALSQDLALRGLGHSGAAAEAFANARTQALLPVYMQELQQRQQAAGQLAGLGSQEAQRGLQAASQLAGLGGQQASRALASGQQITGTAGQQLGRQAQNLAQQIATQQSLIQPLAQLGGTQAERTRSDLANALEVAGLPRQIAGQQAEANQQEMLRRQALQENILLGPLGASSFLPASFGQTIRQSGGGLFGK